MAKKNDLQNTEGLKRFTRSIDIEMLKLLVYLILSIHKF